MDAQALKRLVVATTGGNTGWTHDDADPTNRVYRTFGEDRMIVLAEATTWEHARLIAAAVNALPELLAVAEAAALALHAYETERRPELFAAHFGPVSDTLRSALSRLATDTDPEADS